ncbi:GNAT family protein [Niallia taxi]|uniref:GNAT family N-acetyltransferase n=1 Tax=Niallia taxi TaxID=2499688 RepID=UPI003981E768
MLSSTHIHIRRFSLEDAESLLTYQNENKAFFERFSMERDQHYYSLLRQQQLIADWEQKWKADTHYQFGIFENENQRLVGTISLFQVVRGSLQSAFIGYFIDYAHNGKGYGTEGVKLVVEYSFTRLKLHRIEAGVMPHNIGSIRVLEKAGFHKEGIARKNVKINGNWEDHQVLAIINPAD